MPDFAQDFIKAIKQIRVARAVVASYRVGRPDDKEILPDFMTPYERGRAQRSSEKIADALINIQIAQSNHILICCMVSYLQNIGFSSSLYGHKRTSHWFEILKISNDQMERNDIKTETLLEGIMRISEMLDEPLANVPDSIMLLKLGMSFT